MCIRALPIGKHLKFSSSSDSHKTLQPNLAKPGLGPSRAWGRNSAGRQVAPGLYVCTYHTLSRYVSLRWTDRGCCQLFSWSRIFFPQHHPQPVHHDDARIGLSIHRREDPFVRGEKRGKEEEETTFAPVCSVALSARLLLLLLLVPQSRAVPPSNRPLCSAC